MGSSNAPIASPKCTISAAPTTKGSISTKGDMALVIDQNISCKSDIRIPDIIKVAGGSTIAAFNGFLGIRMGRRGDARITRKRMVSRRPRTKG